MPLTAVLYWGPCLTQKTKQDLQIEVTYVVFTLEELTVQWGKQKQTNQKPHKYSEKSSNRNTQCIMKTPRKGVSLGLWEERNKNQLHREEQTSEQDYKFDFSWSSQKHKILWTKNSPAAIENICFHEILPYVLSEQTLLRYWFNCQVIILMLGRRSNWSFNVM